MGAFRWAAVVVLALGCGGPEPGQRELADAPAGAAGAGGRGSAGAPVIGGEGGEPVSAAGSGGVAGMPIKPRPCDSGTVESCRTSECSGVKRCVSGEWEECECVAPATGGSSGVGGRGEAGAAGLAGTSGSGEGGEGAAAEAGHGGRSGAGGYAGESRGGSGGTGGAACVPMTEDEACNGVSCGTVSDGCGGEHDCGGCPATKYCSSANLCLWLPECDCNALGFECGSIPQSFAGYECPEVVRCGDRSGYCAAGEVCGINFDSDAFVCSRGTCAPSAVNTCADQISPDCRVAYDNCSRIYSPNLGKVCPGNCGPPLP